MTTTISKFLLVTCVMMACVSPTQAYNRRFVYSYEAGGMPKGLMEFEPWVTYKHYGNGGVWEFRNELEYGLTEDLLISAYLSDWTYDGREGASKATWKTAGLEFLYTMTDPTLDWIGSAIYGEFLIGPEKFAIEAKLILHKNFGPLSLVYNGILEAEWEGSDYAERVGVIENTVGASFQVQPKLFFGLEATHEVEFAEWAQAGEHAIFVGPNLSFRTSGRNLPGAGSFFATVSALFQASDIDDEPESQVRLIMGYFF